METNVKPQYDTGRLGMSDPEIDAEMEGIRQAVISRETAAAHALAAPFYLHTPQEIHRVSVLNAMRLASSCIVYRDYIGWKQGSARYAHPYISPCGRTDPKYLGTAEQRDAYMLSDAELSSVWKAQSERLKSATVVENAVPASAGGPISGVIW